MDSSPDLIDPNAARDRMAEFVRTLGRGPGRSRSLTREEAHEAFTLMLDGLADPHQIGAFMMLLRYRGEAVPEIAGIVEAIRTSAGVGIGKLPSVALDWPSYGSGKTRAAPWYLLAALTLAAHGIPVVMHGSNEFTAGVDVATALPALGLAPAASLEEAAGQINATGFAYLPLAAISPRADELLSLRRLLGLRSPLNTAARLINPFDAPAAVDGVFHPPYIDVHLGVSAALGRERLLVIKGSGGEAERNPAKPAAAHLQQNAARSELALPALTDLAAVEAARRLGLDSFAAIWRNEGTDIGAVATITGTIALALLAMGRVDEAPAAQDLAEAMWHSRHRRR